MSISREATIISNKFAKLRQFGFLVYNFNTRSKMPRNMAKLTDYIVVGVTGLHFIEVKLSSTKDRMNPPQLALQKLLRKLEERCIWIHYWKCVSSEEANFIFDNILAGTVNQKGD